MTLKDTIDQKAKRDRTLIQMSIAILGSTAVLAGAAFAAPMLLKEEPVPEPVVEAPRPDAFAGMRIQGKAAIVYDLTTGETLYAENAEAQLPLASLTKLLTVYAGATTLEDDAPVTITASALSAEGESGFIEGEVFTFRDAAELALVASSNDAAAAIAEAAQKKRGIAGSALMASAAQAAHLSQTYALNGTGLDEDAEVSGGYGSARDVALLAGALLEAAPELAYTTTKSTVSVVSETGIPHEMRNTNQGVVEVPGALLSKTGFTDLAGGNLAVVFDAGFGHPVAVVVLGSTIDGRFSDVKRLMDAAFAHFAGTTPS
ncbi:MAG TPA: serine hydrolase [Candidatus Paceibacterota bacterium]|nr:serine hydrolase [Candidatus Paceibacterota bacterium]